MSSRIFDRENDKSDWSLQLDIENTLNKCENNLLTIKMAQDNNNVNKNSNNNIWLSLQFLTPGGAVSPSAPPLHAS